LTSRLGGDGPAAPVVGPFQFSGAHILRARCRYHRGQPKSPPNRPPGSSPRAAPPSSSATLYRDLIIAVAARQKLPAVYGNSYDVTAGGLISYANDLLDQFRQAAAYVDRILKGAKPAEMPVQAPTKYQLMINLKTAKALGLTVPDTLLARADGVIE
jgi:putative tryptophan/tyrosine transport system substrate-binding protein